MVKEIKKAKVAGIASMVLSLSGGVALPAWGAPLQNWRFDPATNQLEVTIASNVKPRYFFLAQPARIVLDLPNTEVGEVDAQASYSGAIRQIRVAQAESGATRIVMELDADAVLAPKQVELIKAASDGRSDRWIFRPIFTATAPPPVRANAAAPSPLGLPPAPPTSDVPEPASIAPQVPTIPSARISQPLQAPPRTGNSLLLSEVNPSLAIPDAFPPVTAPPLIETPSVSVPPLNPRSNESGTRIAPPANEFPIPSDFPSAPINIPTPVNPQSISVPPLNREAVAPETPRQPAARRPARPRSVLIEFGQPLPDSDSAITPQSQRSTPRTLSMASDGDVILAAGSRLNVRYAGTEPLKLQGNNSRPEILILQTAIRDRAGRLVAAPGSAVFGRFESDRSGSRFVADTINVNGRMVTLIGQTDAIGGARQVQDNRLLLNSGLGALAGALIGGISGNGLSGGNVLGGAALGAGVTYVTAPRPATIQPGQTFELQLREDFR